MKKTIKVLGTIAIIVLVMITVIACGPPRLRGTVNIDGDPMLGNTLTANIASLGGSGIITYQWLKDGSTAIADTNSYTLQDADKDSSITVTVIRSDNSGSVTSASVTAYGYIIGDTGPGGGIVFYRNPNGFTITETGETANYLEAAPVNQGTNLAWASSRYIAVQIAGTGVGTGRANTNAILAVDVNAPAASACKNYNGGGKSDWFLPSRDELNAMYKAKNHLGISSGYFWSSSQYHTDNAWGQYFGSGGQGNFDKGFDYYVRAVRAF